MSFPGLKRHGIVFTLLFLTTVILSLIWKVPYIYTIIGFAAWGFAGHLITIEDDVPGGWSNPDGYTSFPWLELAIKAAVLFGLVGLTLVFPSLRAFGT